MSQFGQIKVKYPSAGAQAIAGGETQPVADDNGRPGWAFKKTAESAATAKFNYFYYDGTYHATTMKDLDSMYFVACVDLWTGNVNQVPFIVVYTPLTGSGDAGAWFHSKHAYLIDVNAIPQAGERCLFYRGKIPKHDFDGARKIKLETRIDTGEYNADDSVYLVSLHTDSSTPLLSSLTEVVGLDIGKHSFHTEKRTVNVALTI